jgi:uncharacterized membrane protein
MKNKFLTQAAMIAALYVVLTYVATLLGLSNGAVQVRFSEALTILPYFTPAAIPGLFVGCLLSNILAGGVLLDIIGGSILTLVAAFFSYGLRKNKFLVCLPPIILNTIGVPYILRFGYGMVEESIPYMMVTVGLGEVISCGILGMVLLFALLRYRTVIFGDLAQ